MEMRFSESLSIFKFIVETYKLNKDKQEEFNIELNYSPD